MDKVTKQSVEYREGTPARDCASCDMSHFGGDRGGRCDLVQGVILRTGVCDRWEAK